MTTITILGSILSGLLLAVLTLAAAMIWPLNGG